MHLTEAEFILYIENRLEGDERTRVETHIGGCAACASQFAAIAQIPAVLSKEVPLRVDRKTRQRVMQLVPSGRRGFMRLFNFLNPPARFALAGLAAVAILVTSYMYFLKKHLPAPSQFRSGQETATIENISPQDHAVVHETPVRFTWRSTSPAGYRFRLFAENGVPLWSAFVRDTTLTLPSSVVLESGKNYLWSIEVPFTDSITERPTFHAFSFRPLEKIGDQGQQ
jgi:hypothetical protein